MFSVDGTTISLSRGDTGAIEIAVTGYAFAATDRALFTIKAGNGNVVKQKAYPLIYTKTTVTPAARTGSDRPITASVDRAAFMAAVNDASGTMTFTYTTDWDTDPADYGITVGNTPVSGDEISVEYEKNKFWVTFFNADTDQLSTGSYSWDVRYVIHPYYDENGSIVDGNQVLTPNSPMATNILTVVGDI